MRCKFGLIRESCGPGCLGKDLDGTCVNRYFKGSLKTLYSGFVMTFDDDRHEVQNCSGDYSIVV